MKYLLIISAILALTLPINAENKIFVTRKPVSNYYNPYGCYNMDLSDISALEKYAFNKYYPRENSLQRLQRLETEAFGTVQSGDIATRYNNVRSAILSRPKENYKTSFMRGLGNYFSGQMTGFTPSLGYSNAYPYTTTLYPNSYNSFNKVQYPSTYGNSIITNYNRGPFGSGYRINNFDTGSSTGVRILD